MLNFDGLKIYLSCGYTDMRKSINGLVSIVEQSFKLDPFEKAAYAFCNRKRDRIKIITWDGDGFWLYLKRLERGHIRWPDKESENTMTLTPDELHILLGSSRLNLKLTRREVTERTAS